jgi:hypothetical protein
MSLPRRNILLDLLPLDQRPLLHGILHTALRQRAVPGEKEHPQVRVVVEVGGGRPGVLVGGGEGGVFTDDEVRGGVFAAVVVVDGEAA